MKQGNQFVLSHFLPCLCYSGMILMVKSTKRLTFLCSQVSFDTLTSLSFPRVTSLISISHRHWALLDCSCLSIYLFVHMSVCPIQHLVYTNSHLSCDRLYSFFIKYTNIIIKDEVFLTVGRMNFPMYLFIAKYIFTGSFKNRSIDIQKCQKYIFQ